MHRLNRLTGHLNRPVAAPFSSAAVSGKKTQGIALVTGASSGIGKATAVKFAQEGYRVIAAGRNESALKDLVQQISSTGGTVCSVVGDVSTESGASSIVDAAAKAYGGLDILVNSAGVLKGGALDMVGVDNWDYNMNNNAKSVFLMMSAAIPHLKKSKAAAILNVSSVNGVHPFGGVLSYCASKAAVDMMTKCASVDLAPYGIRVNSVNPGVTKSELQKRGGLDDAKYAAFVQRSIEVTHPLGAALKRICTAEEIADAIFFLCSPASSYTTGATLVIDGGRQNLGAR